MRKEYRREDTPDIESRIFFKNEFNKPEPTICQTDGIITHGRIIDYNYPILTQDECCVNKHLKVL